MKIISILIIFFMQAHIYAEEVTFNPVPPKNIENFLEKTFKDSPLLFKGAAIIAKNKIPNTNWTEYLTIVQIEKTRKLRDSIYEEEPKVIVEIAQTIFTDGFFVTGDIYDPNNNKFLSEIYRPTPGRETSIIDRLIYGDLNASNKIIIYTDPLCKTCKEEVPSLLKKINSNKTSTFSVFLVVLPLKKIYPASETLSKIILYELSSGDKSMVSKIFEVDIDPTLSNEDRILGIVNDKMKTNLSKEKINSKNILAKLEKDRKNATSFMVNKTPTIFLNGVKSNDILRDIDKLRFQ